MQRTFAHAFDCDRTLWVKAAQRYRIFAYDPWGFALVTAPTLGDMFELNDRYASLNYTLAQFRHVVDSRGNVGILLDFSAVPEDIRDFVSIRDAVAFTTFLHDLWGGTFPFGYIELPPKGLRDIAFDFRARVTQAKVGCAAWLWPESLMRATLPLSDSVLHKAYVSECDELLSCRHRDALLSRILALIEKPGGYDLSMAEIARICAVSERTLQRKLATLGLSFRDVVAERRRRAAEDLLLCGRRSVASIAEELGYAEVSSFHQAFRRWTGLGPRDFRRLHDLKGHPPEGAIDRVDSAQSEAEHGFIRSCAHH